MNYYQVSKDKQSQEEEMMKGVFHMDDLTMPEKMNSIQKGYNF